MSRSSFTSPAPGRTAPWILAVSLAAACALPAPAAAPAAKPNLVFILADDLGYGDVQALNPVRGRIKTPHLDRLVAQGMTFTDAHSGSAVCTPTRYGLLTGRYAWRTHLQRGVYDGVSEPPLIAADRLTVGAFLRQHGYATAAIGKWHLGFQAERPPGAPAAKDAKKTKKMGEGGLPVGSIVRGGPTARGFDYFWGCSNARTMASLIENDRVIENLPPIDMLPRLGRRAVDYVAERAPAAKAGQPFFLYVPLTSPHTPILPTEEWKGKSGLGAYGDFVMQTDAVVGDLLAALDRHGLAENTLVLFSADNGCSPAAGTPALEQQGHFASAQFRGYKADIWEGGHRVPFLARWPGRIQPGSTNDRTICLTDFIATCADLLGATLPAAAAGDSVSFLPALLGRAGAPPRPAVVHHSIQGAFAIRDGPWKLILGAGSGGWAKPGDAEALNAGLPPIQLYHLADDPGETKNLQATRPEIVSRLRGLLDSFIARGRSTPGPEQKNDATIVVEKSAGPAAKR